jgi:hypothetical protein
MAEDRKRGSNNAPPNKGKKKEAAAEAVSPEIRKSKAASKQSVTAARKISRNLALASHGDPTALGYLADHAPHLVVKAKEKGEVAIDKKAAKKEAAYASPAARERRANKAAIRRAKKAASIAAAANAAADAARNLDENAEVTAELSAETEE